MIADLFRWVAHIIEAFIDTETSSPFGRANLALSFLLGVALVALFGARSLIAELFRLILGRKPEAFSAESPLIAFAILAAVILASLWMLWRESPTRRD